MSTDIAKREALARVDGKQQAIAQALPLTEASLRSFWADFTVRYAHETTAIEGNTLTLYETRVVLEDGLAIGGKPIREHLEVLNLRNALAWVRAESARSSPPTEETVRMLHQLVMQGLLGDEAGHYRRHPVYIAGAWHVPQNWVKVPDLMTGFSVRLQAGPGPQEHPIAFAAWAHAELVRIHPFADGNGRTARLLAALITLRAGYLPPLCTATERAPYMRALDYAHTTADLVPFVILTGHAVETLQDRYLELVRQQEEAQRAGSDRNGTGLG